MQTLLQDLRFAFRQLLKNPGFTSAGLPETRLPKLLVHGIPWIKLFPDPSSTDCRHAMMQFVKRPVLSSTARNAWIGALCAVCQLGLAAPGDVKWRFPLSSPPVVCPALGTNGILYIATSDGVQALDSSTGQLQWKTNVLGVYNPPVLGPDGAVYIGELTALLALDGNTGLLQWRASLGPYYPSTVVGWNGVVFMEGGSVFALDRLTGEQKWRFYREGGNGPLALGANSVLYFPTYDGKVLALNTASGQKEWEFEGPANTAFYPLSIGPDGTVYAPSSDGNLYALDGLTGQSNWVVTVENGSSSHPVIGPDGTLYVGSTLGGLYAFDGTTGALQWEHELGNSHILSPALAADGTLYVPTGDRLYALNILTRATNWFFEATNGGRVLAPNIGPDGTIYFGVYSGPFGGENPVYALHGSSPLADSAWPKFQQNTANSGQWQSQGPTRITRPPRERWAAENSSTRFEFYSPAARPLHVQWRFNGEPMAGATNEVLTLEHIQFADAGRYSVVISNRYGTATSAEAILSVGYSLSVNVVGPGEVLRDVDLPVYPSNSVVQLTALPRTNRNFLAWSGSIVSASNELTVTMRSNIQLTATFEYQLGDVKWYSPFADAPALDSNGMLYAFDEGWIVAVDTIAGRGLWRHHYFDGWWAPAAIGRDGTVYIGNYGGHSIMALDGITGDSKGGFDVGICVHSCPTIGVDGTLYLAGLNIYAYDPESRELRWSFEGGSIFESSPALSSDGVLYAGCYDGKMYALNSTTGAKLWEFATGGLIQSSPAIGADGSVYFGSADGKVYALDGNTGGKRWEFAADGPVVASAVIDSNGDIYIGGASNFYALHGQTGEIKWTLAGEGGGTGIPEYTSAAALAADGTLHLGGRAIDSRNGEVLWSAGVGGRAPTIGPDGTLYVGGSAIHATSPLADSPWPKFHRDANNTGRAPARPLLDARRSQMTTHGFELVVHSELGERIQVEWTSNLRDWNVLNVLTNAAGTERLLDPGALDAPSRFYRARPAE